MLFNLSRSDHDFLLLNSSESPFEKVTDIKYNNKLLFLEEYRCNFDGCKFTLRNLSLPLIFDITSLFLYDKKTSIEKKYKVHTRLKSTYTNVDNTLYKLRFDIFSNCTFVKGDIETSIIKRVESEFYFEIFSFECENEFDAVMFSFLFASKYTWNI